MANESQSRSEPAWGTPDPEFDAWVKTLPQKYWAKYDLSACRLGWHAARSERGTWISVKDRLPESGQPLAITADGEIDIYQWNLVGDYANDPDPSARITHWMPLPPRPTERKEQ